MPRAPVSLGPMARYAAPRRPDCELPELLKEVVWTKRRVVWTKRQRFRRDWSSHDRR